MHRAAVAAPAASTDRFVVEAPPTPGIPHRLGQILVSEESVYGLILVSGMIVVSNTLTGTSANALLTVVVTVIVFFAAHVYAGTIAGLAREHRGDFRASFRAALHHSEGMLVISVIPVVILLLGVSRVIDDDLAIWAALLVDTAILGVVGWFAVARWNPKFWVRITSALITAGFGFILVLLKAFIHH